MDENEEKKENENIEETESELENNITNDETDNDIQSDEQENYEDNQEENDENEENPSFDENAQSNIKKEKSKKIIDKLISLVILIVCICGLIYSGKMLYTWILNNIKSNSVINDVNEIAKVPDVEDDEDPGVRFGIDFEALTAYNSDVVGWIRIPRTSINYSVVQGRTNNDYLRHSIDGTWNEFGWIFMDYKNDPNFTDRNTIIYGHHIVSGLMFADLSYIYNNQLGNDVDIQIYRKDYRLLTYKVFSTYICDPESYYLSTVFANDEKYQEFLDTIKDRSVIDFHQSLTTDDTILTLSTCTTDAKRRIVVHAKLVSNVEMPR